MQSLGESKKFFCYWCSISSILGKYRWPDIDWISLVSCQGFEGSIGALFWFSEYIKESSQSVRKLELSSITSHKKNQIISNKWRENIFSSILMTILIKQVTVQLGMPIHQKLQGVCNIIEHMGHRCKLKLL